MTKIPRFAFEKFPGSEPVLTTAMKSVGEAMAIGRTIHESLQKALASMETGLCGFDEIDIPGLGEGEGFGMWCSGMVMVAGADYLLVVYQYAADARVWIGCVASLPRQL